MCLIMVLMRFVRRNNMIGFVIWSLLGVFIIGLGIKDMFSKNPVGFWANTETIKVKDVKGYNRASGLLFIIYPALTRGRSLCPAHPHPGWMLIPGGRPGRFAAPAFCVRQQRLVPLRPSPQRLRGHTLTSPSFPPA